ncbi:cytochrome b/b6 domain-containing protein [bacterium SCSIO 12696]|nr:cytochrome b/b6 domain-containing protein [bacterium SCSIO 12696]
MIWDIFVRIFHWCMAGAFISNYWFLEEGDPPHEWVGYAILVFIGLRLIWGFIGTETARFRQFWPTWAKLKAHIQGAPQSLKQPHYGHNPLGALMVLFLLGSILVCGISGWMQEWDMFWGEDWVQLTHSISADIAMIAAGVHVLAVLVVQSISKVPLIKQMIFGR